MLTLNDWLWRVIIFPILEELVFRGVLWDFPCLNRLLGASRPLRCIISSVLFTLAHVLWWQDIGYVAVFIPSLGFAALRAYAPSPQQGIIRAMLAHSLSNGVFYYFTHTLQHPLQF
jgi:membrane protease YdiL (CAAX protease family)